MALEISGVTLCPSNDLITAAYLDYPRTGPVDGYAFDVYGWVVSKEPVAEVEFVHEGIVIACCELEVQRPDVAKEFGSSSRVGFWKAIGTVGLAPAFTIGVRVVFQDGRRREIAEIRGTQQLTSAFTPTMQPITVTSPGRSGSTLLMRMLAEHPDIIVHERFPYEQRVCSYWMHFVQVLATPVDTSQAESFEFWTDRKRLHSVPFFLSRPGVFAGSAGRNRRPLVRLRSGRGIRPRGAGHRRVVLPRARPRAKTRDTCILRGEVRPGRPHPLDNVAALPADAGDIPRPGSKGHPGLCTGVRQ